MKILTAFQIVTIMVLNYTVLAQEPTRYTEPPRELKEIIEAPSTPSLWLNPSKTHVLISYPQEMPDISELAQPELKLAGVRINPENYGSSRTRFWEKLTLMKTNEKEEYPVIGLPEGGKINFFRWSPDGKHLAIVIYLPKTIDLWVVDISSGIASCWARNLNDAIISSPIEWAPDSKSILFTSRVLYREPFPSTNPLPEGPSVQQTSGVVAQVRTFQDMLQNPSDEMKFEHFATSCIMRVSENEEPIMLWNPGMFTNFSTSPDGQYILVEQLMRPFSYSVPYSRFPIWVDVWTHEGSLFKKLAEIPLAESIPQGFSAVRQGPRSYQWRADAPATLVWVEAQDEGDPKKSADIRDQLFYLEAPFKDKPTAFLSLSYRYAGIHWGWNNFAVVYESWWETRKVVTSFFNPSEPGQEKIIVWDRSRQDAYGDPGRFITENNLQGKQVLRTNKSRTKLYLSGQGASPEGSMPFVDEFDIDFKQTKRLWQCRAPYYETFIDFMESDGSKILTSRESIEEQPNYFIHDLKRKKVIQFTSFPHPYPQLKDVQKDLVKYTREDGIELTANLYLPAGYVKGSELLPVLMWAYPEEYVDPSLASQVKESPYRFIRPSRLSPVMWVARGYAVLDRLGMPIVRKDTLEPNDTFIEQLVSNAKAAVDYLVGAGIADPQRIAIGGHSYGAFMTANLLAHSDLFAAGIARSGAYNRTLTPFGFQGEERNLWQASDVYLKMSPFMYADKLKTPILFIHGEDDNNSGTFPMQTERMYSAIKGHGGTARMVVLPFEGHGYRARQSIMHSTWEMDRWLEMYLKK
jgi:dipeptidyl aminopeptidase/acylaminoacyl peptidase